MRGVSSAATDRSNIGAMRIKRDRRADVSPRRQARRALRREFVTTARYMLEGSRGQSWRTCRIVDISREGAGVELFDTTTEEATAHPVVLELEIPPAVLRLRGDVRHARSGVNGGVHVGLHFTRLAALEQDLLDSLVGPESPAH